MIPLHSPTHTLSIANIDDYQRHRSALTYSDRAVLHYSCHPDGGPVLHVFNPAEPYLCRTVHAKLADAETQAVMKCIDGDLPFRLVNGLHHLVADRYCWEAERDNAPKLTTPSASNARTTRRSASP